MLYINQGSQPNALGHGHIPSGALCLVLGLVFSKEYLQNKVNPEKEIKMMKGSCKEKMKKLGTHIGGKNQRVIAINTH